MEQIKNIKLFKSKKGYIQLLLPLLLNVWFWLGVAIFVLILVFSTILFVDKIIGIVLIIAAIWLFYQDIGPWWVYLVMIVLGILMLWKGDLVGLNITAAQGFSMLTG